MRRLPAIQKLSTIIFLLTIGHNAQCYIPGLEQVSSDYKTLKIDTLTPNIPPPRSVDSLNVCGPATATILLDHEICTSKQMNCSNLKPDQRSSLLDMVRLSVNTDKITDPKDIESYPKEILAGSSGINALINSTFKTKEIAKESCAPFDAFVSRHGTKADQEKAESQIWQGIKNMYDTYKSKSKECATCATDFATTSATELQRNYGLKTDNAQLVKAFSAKTYQEFLGQLLIPENCTDNKNLLTVFSNFKKPTYWPTLASDQNFNSTIDKVKEVLKTRPIMVNRVCLLPSPSETCVGGNHTNAITGYRYVCKISDPKDCEHLIRVDNNWGETWNKENNDGWISAKTFFSHTMYSQKNLVWLDDADAMNASSGN